MALSDELIRFLVDEGQRHSLLLSVPDDLLASKREAEANILEGYRRMLESNVVSAARRVRLLSAIPACSAAAAALFADLFRHTGHTMYLFDTLSVYIDARLKIFSDAGVACTHYSLYSFNSQEELAERFLPQSSGSCPFNSMQGCNLKSWDYCKIARTLWMLRESGEKFVRVSSVRRDN